MEGEKEMTNQPKPPSTSLRAGDAEDREDLTDEYLEKELNVVMLAVLSNPNEKLREALKAWAIMLIHRCSDEKDQRIKELEGQQINPDCQGSHVIPSELDEVLKEKDQLIKELTTETEEQARLLGMSGSKEAKLLGEIEEYKMALQRVFNVACDCANPRWPVEKHGKLCSRWIAYDALLKHNVPVQAFQ